MLKVSVNGATHEFDPESITNKEAMALERATGMTFGEWAEALKARSALAMTGMVWLIERRVLPQLKFSEVEFELAHVDVDDLTAVEGGAAVVDPTSEPPGTTSQDGA